MDILKVYHFHNGSGGGVLSVIKNLVTYCTDNKIENHIIHAINKEQISAYQVEEIEHVFSQQLFYYTGKNNFYYTCRELFKLLPDEKAVIVAHDWLELGMAGNLGLQNPVVHVLHGNYSYYFNLAVKHSDSINAFICISPAISEKLKKKLPLRVKDVFLIFFPVPYILPKQRTNEILNIIYYVGNIKDPNKNFSAITKIANGFNEDPQQYFFTICGSGMNSEEFFKKWPILMKDRVNYYGYLDNNVIIKLLQDQDIFLLPSHFEGLPISLIESMKAGVIPLVTKWDESVHQLLSDTGYTFIDNDVEGYVSKIKELEADRLLLQKLSQNCILKANKLFDPINNTKQFEKIYRIASEKIQLKRAKKEYGSRLDQPWLGNRLTHLIRKKLKKDKNA